MYQKYCKKCGSSSLHTKVKGNNTGLYCSECGKWQQWLSKDDIRAFEYNQKIVKMRDSTPEESRGISEYIESISKETSINFFEEKTIVERLITFVEYLDKKIDSEYEKLPLSAEDAIRKNSYCLALEQDKNAIQNIISGYDFNYGKDDKS